MFVGCFLEIVTGWMFLANSDVCGMFLVTGWVFLANFDVCGMFLANGKRMELRIFYLLGKEKIRSMTGGGH